MRPYPWGLLLDPVPLVPHPTLLSKREHAWTAGQRRGLRHLTPEMGSPPGKGGADGGTRGLRAGCLHPVPLCPAAHRHTHILPLTSRGPSGSLAPFL